MNGDAAKSRNAFARQLALIVAVSGLLIATVGIMSLQILRTRSERSSHEALRAIAEQASMRIAAYLAHQRELLRALAGAVSGEPDAQRRLAQASLDAPSLGRVQLVDAQTPRDKLPARLTADQLAEALRGKDVASPLYFRDDLTPAIDACTPVPTAQGKAVCATLDMLELQRQVQRIHVGDTGFALAFGPDGRLFASGAGSLRAAVLSGEMIAESKLALDLADGRQPPPRFESGIGAEVIAGWARLKDPGWTIVVEQPTREALRASRAALLTLGSIALVALLVAIGLGVAQSRRVLTALEIEERWRTAGRIATGITHDLGHRLAILQSTAALAEANDPNYLPLIRDNLRAETATLKKFVADFADLSRDVDPTQFVPLDLNAFADSVQRTAAPFADKAAVKLSLRPSPTPIWVKADRYLLERAVLNLLSNAVEASPPGAEVTVEVGAADSVATLRVRDRGPGIAPERLPRIFDAFKSTKRTGAHVGMGLPNVRRIVDAHGGRVTVTSELGRGSTFEIVLPASATPS